MINASQAIIGKTYKSLSNFQVEIVEINPSDVVVKSLETGHLVSVDLDYKLVEVDAELPSTNMEEKKMNDEATPAVQSTRKVKKSTLVDEGLKGGLSVEDIIKNVLTAFPEAPEKSIRNLISVRRSKMKKPSDEVVS